MVNVFVSYSVKNNQLMEHLNSKLLETGIINPVIVPKKDMNLAKNSDKVTFHLEKSTVFICILTEETINNQWVNQEMAYWIGKNHGKLKNLYVLLDKAIQHRLKGFITYDNDMPFRYDNKEGFNLAVDKLIKILLEKYSNYGYYCIY